MAGQPLFADPGSVAVFMPDTLLVLIFGAVVGLEGHHRSARIRRRPGLTPSLPAALRRANRRGCEHHSRDPLPALALHFNEGHIVFVVSLPRALAHLSRAHLAGQHGALDGVRDRHRRRPGYVRLHGHHGLLCWSAGGHHQLARRVNSKEIRPKAGLVVAQRSAYRSFAWGADWRLSRSILAPRPLIIPWWPRLGQRLPNFGGSAAEPGTSAGYCRPRDGGARSRHRSPGAVARLAPKGPTGRAPLLLDAALSASCSPGTIAIGSSRATGPPLHPPGRHAARSRRRHVRVVVPPRRDGRRPRARCGGGLHPGWPRPHAPRRARPRLRVQLRLPGDLHDLPAAVRRRLGPPKTVADSTSSPGRTSA